jgi:hypothetical protein
MFAVQVFDLDGMGGALIGGMMVSTIDYGEVSRQVRARFAGRHYYFNCQRQ